MTLLNADLARLRAFLDETIDRGENRLPPEPALSAELGISRGKLRTLLKRLEKEGLIWRHVGKGTFIGPRQLAVEDSPISSAFSVDNILQARSVLEPQLAALAAIHATTDDIRAMDACLADRDSCTTMLQWKHLDERLHRIIAQATHNVLLLTLYDTLRAQMKHTLDRRIEQVFGAEPGPKEDTDSEHALIIDAIRNHDPQAAERAMRSHLQSVRGKLFGLE